MWLRRTTIKGRLREDDDEIFVGERHMPNRRVLCNHRIRNTPLTDLLRHALPLKARGRLANVRLQGGANMAEDESNS